MLSRHTNELLSRLEQVADIGCAVIRKKELLYWYGQERQTLGIWRDLQEKWDELLETIDEFDIPLLVGEADGVWTFAWGEGLKVTQKSWFKDVAALAKLKNESDLEAA